MTFHLTIFIISFIGLLWSGKVLQQTLVVISRQLRISEFFTAFVLASFATSVPELFVGVSSALQGVPHLSLADTLGSNIANSTIVIGLAILAAGKVSVDRKISTQNYWLISLIAFLPLILLIDGVLSRVDGLILLIAFALYIGKLFRDKDYFHRTLDGTEEPQGFTSFVTVMRSFGKFLVGTFFLLVSAVALVWASKLIVAQYFNHDLILFGVIFIALGTSLPEIIFGINTARGGHAAAMLGNALGSVAFNAAGIIGIVALIQPIEANFVQDYLSAAFFLFFSFVLFHYFARTRRTLTRKEGLGLVVFYIVFIVFMF